MSNPDFNKPFRVLKYFIIVTLLLFSFPSCTDTGDNKYNNDDNIIPGEEITSSLERDTIPVIDTATDLQSQVDGNNDFAFDMYSGILDEESGNIFFSPYSISIALAMTWAGASGETESDMADAMNFMLTQEDLHPVFNYIDLELAARGEGAEGTDGEGFRLNVQNSIWGQTGYTFLETFLDTLALNYGAGLRLLDFASDPEGAREEINAWIEEVTEGRIEDLIPEGSLSTLTRLVLANAIYFNAAWSNPFDEELTQDENFQTGTGEDVLVPMMNNEESMPYLEGDGFEAVEVLYDGEELSMLIILPEDLAEFESGLTCELLSDIRDGMQNKTVNLSMPSWELEGSTISLKEILSSLGMESAFNYLTADFSGMDGTNKLFISDVLHQAFIKVNEEGTEAAAATAVKMEESIPVDVVYLTLDQPFIYLIQDRPTGQVLFLGRLTDPR